MEKHLLVTVSGDKSALHGARFVSDFFTNKDNIKLTLFYTAARPLKGDKEMPGYEALAEIDKQAKQREKKGRAATAQAKTFMAQKGFPEKNIHTKFKFRSYSTAVDIILEGEEGLFDSVVLGCRGLTWLESLVEDSVTRELMRIKFTLPFWICRYPEKDRKHVLLCVDDSTPAMRMVDHVGFMLADEPSHDITLLNIYDPGSEDRMFAETVFEQSRTILEDHGVAPERIKPKIVESRQIAKTILHRANTDKYAVVALGRTGEDRGFWRKIFMGSVSGALFKELSGAALWICH